MKHEPITRDEQIAKAVQAIAELRQQGWAKATVEVTRGGTVRVEVEAEGGKVAVSEWRPKVGRVK